MLGLELGEPKEAVRAGEREGVEVVDCVSVAPSGGLGEGVEDSKAEGVARRGEGLAVGEKVSVLESTARLAEGQEVAEGDSRSTEATGLAVALREPAWATGEGEPEGVFP